MSMNDVEVCNLALGRIGQGASKPIQSLTTDQSEAARACARVFATAMRTTLREFAWPFAQKAVALAAVDQVVPGWTYVYAYPTDCLFLHGLSDDETDPTRAPNTVLRPPFKIFAATSGESCVIATDLPDAWAWYTRDVSNPAFGDDMFGDALAWKVAAEIALGLKASPQMAQSAMNAYVLALSKAGAAAGNEAGVDAQPDVESIRAYL